MPFDEAVTSFSILANLLIVDNACELDEFTESQSSSTVVVQRTLFSAWGCSFEKMMYSCQSNLQKNGTQWCKAVIIPVGYSGQSSPGYNMFSYIDDNWGNERLTVPMVQSADADVAALIELYESDPDALIHLVPTHNRWKDIKTSTVWTVVFALVTFGCLCLIIFTIAGLRKISIRCKRRNITFWGAINVQSLIIELVVNIEQLIYFAVDPLMTRSILGITADHVLTFFPAGLSFATSMLLVMYYRELLATDKLQMRVTITGYRVQFAIAFGLIMFLADMVTAVAIGFYFPFDELYNVIFLIYFIAAILLTFCMWRCTTLLVRRQKETV